jgi:hypothetical protein
VLPQVLAGLGVVSVASAGCVLWLERFQPFFAFTTIVSLAYQSWLVWRRPRRARTPTMLAVLWASVGTSAAVGLVLVVLWLRYR